MKNQTLKVRRHVLDGGKAWTQIAEQAKNK